MDPGLWFDPHRFYEMIDPYHLLNVSRDADPDAIKQAYRKLAKKLHPDQNPGNKQTEQRFKEITQAYNLLSDPKSKHDYDRGRIDAAGRPMRRTFRSSRRRKKKQSSWSQSFEAIVDQLLGSRGQGRTWLRSSKPSAGGQARGSKGDSRSDEDRYQRLSVDFLTAVHGGKQRMTTADGKALDIDIPRGTDDKAVLRLKRERQDDLLLQIKVLDHPLFMRRGQDLYLDLPISLKEALLGARIRTPTIDGPVSLTVPAHANSGQLLRLKGKGVASRQGVRGDQYIRLMIMLPREPTDAMAMDLDRLANQDDYQVRHHLDQY